MLRALLLITIIVPALLASSPSEAAGKKTTTSTSPMCKAADTVCTATCNGTKSGLDSYIKCLAECGRIYKQCTGGRV